MEPERYVLIDAYLMQVKLALRRFWLIEGENGTEEALAKAHQMGPTRCLELKKTVDNT